MRNTQQIGSCTKRVKNFSTTDSEIKITTQIEPLIVETNIASTNRPLHIPFFSLNKTQHLGQAIKLALERVKEESKNIVIMHNPFRLSSKSIQDALIECGEDQKSILLHPQMSENNSHESLRKYILNPVGIYVVPEDNFVGMESQCVIYCLHDDKDKAIMNPLNLTSIRCHLSRAVSTLCVIHEMNINEYFSRKNTYL